MTLLMLLNVQFSNSSDINVIKLYKVLATISSWLTERKLQTTYCKTACTLHIPSIQFVHNACTLHIPLVQFTHNACTLHIHSLQSVHSAFTVKEAWSRQAPWSTLNSSGGHFTFRMVIGHVKLYSPGNQWGHHIHMFLVYKHHICHLWHVADRYTHL